MLKTINEHIKNQKFVPFYLLYGEEDYLKKQMKDRLMQALVNEGDMMNVSIFEGKKTDFLQVIDIAKTMPFFAQHRVVVLEETELGKKCSDAFLKELEQLPDTTVMIFIEKTIDKRSKIYKFIHKNGYAAEMSIQDEKQLMFWMAGLLKKEEKQITTSNASYFLHRVGTDMNTIRNEIEKLVAYTGSRKEITKKDIETICSEEVTAKIFEMLEAIMEKQQKKALHLYEQLLEQKEPPLKVLALLVRQCNQLIIVNSMTQRKIPNKDIASRAKIHPFVVKKLQKQASKYSMKELQKMVFACGQTDEGIKTGKYNDRIGVELLIVEFSTP